MSSGKKEDEYTLSDEAEQILEIEMVIMTVDEFIKELERDILDSFSIPPSNEIRNF